MSKMRAYQAAVLSRSWYTSCRCLAGVNELHSKPGRRKSQHNTCNCIRYGNEHFSAPQERYCLKAKGRESGEPAKQPRQQQQLCLRIKQIVLLRKASDHAGKQAAQNIHDESGQREPGLCSKLRQEDARSVARRRPDKATNANDQDALHDAELKVSESVPMLLSVSRSSFATLSTMVCSCDTTPNMSSPRR